jgi:hypothetical protein
MERDQLKDVNQYASSKKNVTGGGRSVCRECAEFRVPASFLDFNEINFGYFLF